MKANLKRWLFLCAAIGLGSAAMGANVRLLWNYCEPANTNLAFNIYWTTNLTLPAGQWPLLTNVLSTDAADATGTNFAVTLDLAPAQYFFIAQSSNFWGESSGASNVAQTPPPPRAIDLLRIARVP